MTTTPAIKTPVIKTPVSPAPALAALGVTVAAALVVLGDAGVGPVHVPAPVLAMVVATGLFLSWLRWQPGATVATPVNLALCFGGAIVLIATRATVDATDPPGGLHAMAEVFAFVVVCRSFALTEPNRVRSALLLSLGALLGGAADAGLGPLVPWLAAWLVAAVACLVLLTELDEPSTVPLRGAAAARRSWRPAVHVLAVTAALLAVAIAVVVVDPDPGRTAPRLGNDPGSQRIAPYVDRASSLDTGNRFTLSDEVVMRVRADAPDFWRGQTFDVWDGRTWTLSRAAAATFPTGGDGSVPSGVGDTVGGGQTFVQRIHVVAPYMQAIYGAYRIDQVETPLPRMLAHGDGSISLGAPIGPGTEYTVISLRQPVTPAMLRDHDPVTDELPTFIADQFLQLPSTVPARVTALAHQLTDDQPTAYDKVQAIERWLHDNTTYTLDIPPLPDGADAVDQHLFVDRRGFCEQIATSTAVLLRSVGVPARLGTGFAPGERSLLGGELTVRARDAHAWVEVWFPGLGWQPFDPTVEVPLAGESSTTWVDRLGDVLGALAPWLAAVAIGALVALGASVLARRLRARRAAARAPWEERFLARLEAAGQARGRPRSPPETPAAYAAALAATVLPGEPVAAAGAVLTRAFYGGGSTAAEREQADAALAAAEAASPTGRSRSG